MCVVISVRGAVAPPAAALCVDCSAFIWAQAARESILMYSVRKQLGFNKSPSVLIGSRLEEAVRDGEELHQLCRICHGRPFIISARVSTKSP